MDGEIETNLLHSLLKQAEGQSFNIWRMKCDIEYQLLNQFNRNEPRYGDDKRLYRHYAQVYSQNGEDGYLSGIFNGIGEGGRTFLEIGIGNGLQNTTRFLLEQGWRGIWIEADRQDADFARAAFSSFIESGNLQILNFVVTAENINENLNAAHAPVLFDLITVDIDQNTSHVWRALDRRARVCCVEYNASIPPSVALEVPYDPNGIWDGSNFFGGSLKTMEIIGRTKGMSLVGCDPQGVNSYFVRSSEVASLFSPPYTAENHYEPPRYQLLTHLGHPPSSTARRWVKTTDTN